MTELKNFNLKLVKKGFYRSTLETIEGCIINGDCYHEEKHIPIDLLKKGCAIFLEKNQKAWLLKMTYWGFFSYITIWEMPYTEGCFYPETVLKNTMKRRKEIISFPIWCTIE